MKSSNHCANSERKSNINYNNRSTSLKYLDIFTGSNFEVFIYRLHLETLPAKSHFSPFRIGFRVETLEQKITHYTVSSNFQLIATTFLHSDICQNQHRNNMQQNAANFLAMTLGTNSWSPYLKKMGYWNTMTVNRNDLSLGRFSKTDVSTTSVERMNC